MPPLDPPSCEILFQGRGTDMTLKSLTQTRSAGVRVFPAAAARRAPCVRRVSLQPASRTTRLALRVPPQSLRIAIRRIARGSLLHRTRELLKSSGTPAAGGRVCHGKLGVRPDGMQPVGLGLDNLPIDGCPQIQA